MFAQDVCEAVTIRGAEDADVDALHAYLVAIAAERLPVLFARSDLPARERVAGRIARNANDARYLLLLAVDRDGVAGMLDFVGNPAAQQLHVGDFGMSVRRECRGQGIGRHLIHALLTWTRPRGYRRIELEVFPNNPDADPASTSAKASCTRAAAAAPSWSATPRWILVMMARAV